MSNQSVQPLADVIQALLQKPQNTWTTHESKIVAAYQLGDLQLGRAQENLPAVSHASHYS